MAGASLLAIALLLLAFAFVGGGESRPITLTQMTHSQCELLASDEMLRSVSATAYGRNFDEVRQRLKLECKPGERFVFFYGDRLETNGWAGCSSPTAPCMKTTRSATAITISTTPGSRNETRSSPLFRPLYAGIYRRGRGQRLETAAR
jgi:hypothetical protein